MPTGRWVPTTAYGTHRGMTAAAERIALKPDGERVAKRPASAWQNASWGYFETISAIHFGLSLMGQLLSRVRIYAGVVNDAGSPPVDAKEFLKSFTDRGLTPAVMTELLTEAQQLVNDLFQRTGPQMLREMALGLSVPGEFYLVKRPAPHGWVVVSSDELIASGDGVGYKLKLDRSSRSTLQGGSNEIELPGDTFIARIWRSHPRYSSEPDSSMLGVLDECELLTVLNQTMRSLLRSRMNAGIVFIPDGLVGVNTEEGATVTDSIVKMAQSAINDESATSTVVPLVLKGPAELGKALMKIDLGRPVDDTLVALADRTLEQILVGIDVPKEIVQGFADVKYANALVIDDSLFRAHIEPLALLIVDSLTQVYLRPMLMKVITAKFGPTADPAITGLLDRIVMWFDASGLITRPDRSQAANEGLDRKVLSEAAWRAARGFAEADAPSSEEILRRIAIERATLGPEESAVLIHSLNPDLFKQAQAGARAESGFSPELTSLLEGEGGAPGVAAPPAPPPSPLDEERTAPIITARQGGELISPNGNLPPRQ